MSREGRAILNGVVSPHRSATRREGTMVSTALIIVALILLLLAAFTVALPKVNVGWLGLAFYVAAAVWVALKLPN